MVENVGENSLTSAVIDTANNYAYFGTYTNPGKVVKVDISPSNFIRVGAVTLVSGTERSLSSAVIDTANNYAYFGTYTNPGRVIKIDISPSNFSKIGVLTLNTGEGLFSSAVIDTSGPTPYAYFGTATSPGKIAKINLSSFDRTGVITLDTGENQLRSATIDTSSGYGYFGTYTISGKIVRIDLDSYESQEGRIKATEVNLPEYAKLVNSVKFYSHLSKGNVRLAIYDSSYDLAWQSSSVPLTTTGDWQETLISSGTPNTLSLNSGDYYLAWQHDSDFAVPSYTMGSQGDGFFVEQSFVSFPSPISGRVYTSETWSMYVDYTPNTPPTLTSLGSSNLTNGSQTTNEAPQFEFTTYDADNDNLYYQIQIDNDPDFSSPEEDYTSGFISGASTVQYFIPTSPLLVGSQHWRVRAVDIDAADSGWAYGGCSPIGGACTTPSFERTLPSARSLSSPPDSPYNLGLPGVIDGSTTNNPAPTFTFSLSDPNAKARVKYQIQVDDNPDFSSLLIDYISSFGTQGDYSFMVGQLREGGNYTQGSEDQILVTYDGPTPYYWRVKAINSNGRESDWTDGFTLPDPSFILQTVLSLSLEGVSAGTIVDQELTTISTAPTALNFGEIVAGETKTGAIKVGSPTTTDPNGYQILISQNHDLMTPEGHTIKGFYGTNENPSPWASPDPQEEKGYFGYSTTNANLTGAPDRFYSNGIRHFARLTPTSSQVIKQDTPVPIPNDYIIFKLEVNENQELGDYSNEITITAVGNY